MKMKSSTTANSDAQPDSLVAMTLAAMTLAEAENEIVRAVYAATRLLEDLEHAGKLNGNAHHARQTVAEAAVHELRIRWSARGEVHAQEGRVYMAAEAEQVVN